ERWPEICAVSLKALQDKRLNYEDATPLLFLREMLTGFQVETGIKHVFVDEAQDYSPFQYAFIRHVFPRANMTVLGDANQAIFLQTADSASFTDLPELLHEDSAEVIRLMKSYRSTREIVAFTAAMLPAGSGITPFERSGEAPKFIKSENDAERIVKIADDARTLLAHGHKTIGILCKTAAESEETFAKLNGHIEVDLITKHSLALREGASVVPAYLAKGIEFDAVIIADGSQSAYSRENERKLFYTACTRAMHVLHIHYTGELTLFATVPQSRSQP
ncbi:MAG TPA: ATP-binding domain-containing protein, partial [Bacilli bacterium]